MKVILFKERNILSNKAIDAMVYCPFYISEARYSITCEGIVGSSTVNRFPTEHEKNEHETNFCTGKTCCGCGVYSALMGNYSTQSNTKRITVRH